MPCEHVPGLRFPQKNCFGLRFFKTTQLLVAPGTTALSVGGKIWGQNIDLHQNLNRVDLSSTSWRIRQCKNISPTPIQWLRISILVQKWHVLTSLTSQRVAIMGLWHPKPVRRQKSITNDPSDLMKSPQHRKDALTALWYQHPMIATCRKASICHFALKCWYECLGPDGQSWGVSISVCDSMLHIAIARKTQSSLQGLTAWISIK